MDSSTQAINNTSDSIEIIDSRNPSSSNNKRVRENDNNGPEKRLKKSLISSNSSNTNLKLEAQIQNYNYMLYGFKNFILNYKKMKNTTKETKNSDINTIYSLKKKLRLV